MATEVLKCSAISSPDSWTLAAGATKMAAVDPAGDDSTYINSGTTINTQQQFALSDPSANIATNATINSVTFTVRSIRGGTNNCNYTVTAVLGADTSTATGTGTISYADANLSMTRPGTGAWTKADLTSLEARIQNTQARDLRCSTFYATVDYTNPAPTNTFVNLERGLRGLNRGIS